MQDSEGGEGERARKTVAMVRQGSNEDVGRGAELLAALVVRVLELCPHSAICRPYLDT